MNWQIAACVQVAMFVAFVVLAGYCNHRLMMRIEDGEIAMKLVSTTTMIKRLEGLLGTRDLSEWEQDFVRKLSEQAAAGHVTGLTGAQVDKLDELHAKHFA